jgi:hypothetical protein
MAAQQQPTYTAYAVTKRGEGQDDWWTPIGAAFEHKDGQGFNIVLQTIPLDGKIVLRPPKASKRPSAPSRPSATRTIAAATRAANDKRERATKRNLYFVKLT